MSAPSQPKRASRNWMTPAALAIGATLLVSLALAEAILRVWFPRPTLFPRYKYSPRYGSVLYPSTTMVHSRPGKWRFEYHINDYGYRGEPVLVSNEYSSPRIVMLGDSQSFGQGVGEGAQYAAILSAESGVAIVNLATPGHGLGQQIRRHYEFGQLYRPTCVIIQFSKSDLVDNLLHPVAEWIDGRVVFHESRFGAGWLKRWLSRSRIQQLQLYNLVRGAAYQAAVERWLPEGKGTEGVETYVGLLEPFVRELRSEDREVFFLADFTSVEEHEFLMEALERLEEGGMLTTLDVRDWIPMSQEGVASPEGHPWGERAHALIAEHLRPILEERCVREG